MYAVNYTFKDGLPSDEVYWVKEGSDGLLWVGCDKGLVSYDGVSFKKYKAPKARNKSMTGIFEDSKGTIWCHNFAGQIYYIKEGELHLFETWEKAAKGKIIKSLIVENDILRIESSFKVWLYDITTKKLQKSGNKYFLLNNGNKLFINGTEGIYSEINEKEVPYYCLECFYIPIVGKGVSFQPRVNFVKSNTLEVLYVHNYFRRDWQNKKGKINEKGMKIPFVFLIQKDTIQGLHFPPQIAKYGKNFIINKIKIIDENIFYLSTSEGLFIWNITTNEVRHFFKGKILSDSFFDTEGNLWLSSLEKGLFFVPRLALRVHDKFTKDKVIYQIETDKHGNVLIGYDDGSITYWNPKENKVLLEKAFPIKKRIQNIIYNEKEDEYWITTEKKTHVFKPLELEIFPRKEVGSAVYDMTFDNLGNVIAAMGHGANMFSVEPVNICEIQLPASWKEQPNWEIYKKQYKAGLSGYLSLFLEGNRTYSILFQSVPEYTIWVGTVSKLLYYSKGVSTEVKDENGARIIATCLEAMNDSMFWVGTLEDGLYCIENRVVVQHINIQRSISYNEIQELKIYKNVLWAVSTSGIIRYDLTTDSLRIWDKGDGLPSWNVFDIAFIGDEIYIATKEGLVSMPMDLEMNVAKPAVKMTQIRVNDSIYPIKSAYQLGANENTLKIQFRGISFRSQNNFRYEYRLCGIEEDWNNVSSASNIVNYPDLSSGNYTFQAVFVKPDGSRSEPLNIAFLISAPFYAEWWFIIFTITLIILIISWIYKVQIDKIKAQNEEKLERSRLERDIRISELKALKAQLNPHFMFNALNSIQDYIIQNERELASDYLGMFSDLMRLYLNHSQEGQLSLKEEINSLKLYLELEAIRMDEDFSYSIEIGEKINVYEIEIPTMLVQPYVENAIKHGLFRKKGTKQIEIFFEQPNPAFILAIVRDNGIGRAAAAKHKKHQLNRHKSFATAANNSRLELLNYGRKISIKAEIIDLEDAGVAKGTEVRINIPIKEESN
jgi:ligand-binding sensor domain-containing protein